MEELLHLIPILIVALLVAVIIVLFIGLGGMAFGGRITPMVRNKLMRARVYIQGGIVLLVLISFFIASLQ